MAAPRVRDILLVLLLLPSVASAKDAPSITIAVDASQAPRRIFSATLAIPVEPGALTLRYPKWIPGEHGPTGPVVDSVGMRFSAAGRPIPWRRDTLDMFTYHLEIPAGVTSLEATIEYVSPVPGAGGFSAGATATDQIAIVSWNTVLLYPAGWTADQLTYTASVRLPSGWMFGTALPVAGETGTTVGFKPVSLYTLVDSPVLTGAHVRHVPLTAAGVEPRVEMAIAAESAAALDMPPATEAHYRQLVAEADALFGAAHYRTYHFLLSLSDHLPHFGLEHHESDDSRAAERSLIDPADASLMAALLPHEFVHSWNGKYRRPADLTTTDYDRPMQTDLLWVYEGLTEYLGDVLAARSGLWSVEQYRDHLAAVAAAMDHQSGRTWRTLQDTATAAQLLYDAPTQWANWRRGSDFYDEGELIWLEAETIIRRATEGRRSLDDFCQRFYGAPSTPPLIKTYTFDDLVTALSQIAAYDWRTFFATRLQAIGTRAPLGGVTSSGWTLTYRDTPTEWFATATARRDLIDARYSLGLLLAKNGLVLDIVFAMAAAEAGLAPGMRIVAVNGRAFSSDVFNEALTGAAATTATANPIELLMENAGYFKTYAVNYHGGVKYPHLERDASQPDLLEDIVRAHAGQARHARSTPLSRPALPTPDALMRHPIVTASAPGPSERPPLDRKDE